MQKGVTIGDAMNNLSIVGGNGRHAGGLGQRCERVQPSGVARAAVQGQRHMGIALKNLFQARKTL